ncbi:hypothetical protein [Pseudonocardia sp. H11422]|uniref:hypothetical protein n=1 Tax=Pseudonocardia sp. H11422 TaxID=2835866 RepID=UPI0020288399|nr:hypothetical protein [Pseudonocardia sp. H11422]
MEYVGKVGTGFTREMLGDLLAKLRPLTAECRRITAGATPPRAFLPAVHRPGPTTSAARCTPHEGAMREDGRAGFGRATCRSPRQFLVDR